VRRLLDPRVTAQEWQGAPPSTWARRVAVSVRMFEMEKPRDLVDWKAEGRPSDGEENAEWNAWKYDAGMVPSEEDFRQFVQNSQAHFRRNDKGEWVELDMFGQLLEQPQK
jgi:hypothetical protein